MPTRLQPLSVATAQERRQVHKRLHHALTDLDRRAAGSSRTPEIQLLVQIAGAPAYARFRSRWTKAWKRSDHSTLLWPDGLGADQCAALLLPLPAGRRALGAVRHPAVVADPVFALGSPAGPADFEYMALAVITEWVATPGEGFSARLAPPVIEAMGRRGALDRWVADFGQDWPLPSPGRG